MSKKRVSLFQFNWGSSLNANPYNQNLALSGTLTGTMASTNTIYTNVIDVRNLDNLGIELTWTGTPTGTISVLSSISGNDFYALTFSPVLAQPAGSASGYVIDLAGYPFPFLAIKYVNASGSGTLKAYISGKDLN